MHCPPSLFPINIMKLCFSHSQFLFISTSIPFFFSFFTFYVFYPSPLFLLFCSFSHLFSSFPSLSHSLYHYLLLFSLSHPHYFLFFSYTFHSLFLFYHPFSLLLLPHCPSEQSNLFIPLQSLYFLYSSISHFSVLLLLLVCILPLPVYCNPPVFLLVTLSSLSGSFSVLKCCFFFFFFL